MNRVSLIGSISGGEIFDTSFWVEGPVIASDTAANAFALTCKNAIDTAANSALRALIGSTTSYDQCRVYCYPDGGPSATFIGSALFSGFIGTATGNILPYQSCMVITLHTGFAGRRRRGRMYLPANGAVLGSHQFNGTNVSNVCTAMAAAFTAINASGAGTRVSVMSQVGDGLVTHVNEVAVDSKVDIQRRRAGHEAPLSRSVHVV